MGNLIIETATLDLSHITTEMAIVHELPFVGVRSDPSPSFRLAPTSSLSMTDLCYSAATVITATEPLSGHELEASREQVVEALKTLREAAEQEGGDGFLLGYNPLAPTARIPASELGFTDECVFVWSRDRGEDPLFDWSDVAHVVTDDVSISVFLVDGRLVTLSADIDWWNRLS
ncbi:hypothetical protein [Sphingomonas sp. 3-13AW]|uniref:hypothetical protein n=1 Tax=Sphingomonas sp. 3-13AW TaxID=3050450 RepID=UPI003BB679D8